MSKIDKSKWNFDSEEEDEDQQPKKVFKTIHELMDYLRGPPHADDLAARFRRPSHHVIPKNWPKDNILRCYICDNKNGHARNLCCLAIMPESHDGELEYMGWRFIPSSKKGLKMGVGGSVIEDEDRLFKIFSEQCQWHYDKMFDEWSMAFRWTCCGLTLDQGVHGCDNHGNRGYCSCDYCRGSRWGGEPYQPPKTQANRLLDIGGKTGWEKVKGIPWSLEMHKYFPKEFQKLVVTLLLCQKRSVGATQLPHALFLEFIFRSLLQSN